MTSPRTRAIRWLTAVAALHIATGAVLPWVAGAPFLDGYHHGIERALLHADASGPIQVPAWWMALFGPTVQVVGLWMLALVRLGDRLRDAAAWRWLIAGMAVWAPQDMLLSLRADCWPHVWIDVLALAVTLPPLAWLARHDRSPS